MIFVELGDRRFEDEGKSMIIDMGNKSTPSSMRATNNKGPTEIALDHLLMESLGTSEADFLEGAN